MTQRQTNSTAQKQKLKKYLVFTIMFLAFAICMWLIFAPSGEEKDKQEQDAGFNADIPDPKNDKIVDSKKTAFEQEQTRLKQEERMRTLEDYSFLLNQEKDKKEFTGNNEIKDSPSTNNKSNSGNTNYTGRRKNSIEASDYAYRDISRTLGNFYENEEKDTEKDRLKEEVEELKNKLQEKDKITIGIEDQVALLEKSYELAAKYGTQGNHQSVSVSDAEIKQTDKEAGIKRVSNVIRPVVSSLHQPDVKRTFHTISSMRGEFERNTISAVIHSDQTLLNGQTVRIRITEAMMANGIIPANTIITGVSRISGERLNITISSIEYNGNIIPVNLNVYDMDGQAGISIPGSMEMNAVKEIAGNMGQGLGSSITISQQNAGQQILGDLGRGLIQGTSQYISKKAREVQVTLKAGYKIFLLPGQ